MVGYDFAFACSCNRIWVPHCSFHQLPTPPPPPLLVVLEHWRSGRTGRLVMLWHSMLCLTLGAHVEFKSIFECGNYVSLLFTVSCFKSVNIDFFFTSFRFQTETKILFMFHCLVGMGHSSALAFLLTIWRVSGRLGLKLPVWLTSSFLGPRSLTFHWQSRCWFVIRFNGRFVQLIGLLLSWTVSVSGLLCLVDSWLLFGLRLEVAIGGLVAPVFTRVGSFGWSVPRWLTCKESAIDSLGFGCW